MALVLKDRVKETTTTTGTGTYTLAGAVTGFEAFSSVGDGNTTYYSCTDGTDFEVGIGTYTSSGTTLARTTILQSSNSDSAVSWSSGTKTIFCAQPAEKAVFLDASGNIIAANGSALTALNASNLASGTVANARLDQQLQDVAGLAVTNGNFIVGDGSNFVAESGATARTSLGLGTAAVLDTGISNTNIPKFTSGVADNDFLRVDGTAIEGRSASEVLSDIAAMPLAGGTFTGDVTFTGDNYNIVFDKSDDALEFADNAKAVFGAGNDLQIFHNGSISYIQDAGTGGLRIIGNVITLLNAANSETMLKATEDGAVEVYHDNVKKLETTADGVSISGDTLGLTSTDAGASAAPSLQLYRNSASPADADDVGQIQFHGENDADEKIEYARIDVRIEDASDGEEDGQLDFEIMEAGSSTLYQRMAFGTNQFYKTLYLGANVDIQFEGDNFNDHETTLTVAEPTADRTITLPDATGTVLTTADSGIGNGNVATFTSGVADNDFLRIDGTSVEGRSASEVLSDIGATTAADAANEATALAIALG